MSIVQRYQSLKEAAQLSLDDGIDQLSEHILNQVVLETIRTYQQKLVVGIEDSASDLLDNFKQNIANHIFDEAAGWTIPRQDNFLFPRGCRFCFRRGKITIIVIEHDPQIRSLSFIRGMQGHRTYEFDEQAPIERVSLSLPYGVFLFRFEDNAFKSMKYFWKTAPLRKLSDNLATCVLPNIHVGGEVCMGRNNVAPDSVWNNMSEICEDRISTFWSSTFSGDLSNEWWSKSILHASMLTGEIWQQKTESDPLFILQVPFRHNDRCLRDLLSGEEDLNQSVFRHKISSEIDSCVGKLFNKISGYLKKTKFEKHAPAEIQDSVRTHLKNSVSEIADVTAVLHHEINKLSVEINTPEKPMNKVGFLWEDN